MMAQTLYRVVETVWKEQGRVTIDIGSTWKPQKAAREVEAAGYAEVHVLEGGVAAWQQAGMPVVKQGVAK